MMQASLTTLIFIYLGGFLSLVFGNWILWNASRLRSERKSLQHRLRCSLCSFEFEDPTPDTLPRCPRCGSLNERTPLGRL
jgi:hypothetical protein